MKITKNTDYSKNNYTGYGLCFDEGSEFGHTVREGNFNRVTNAKNVKCKNYKMLDYDRIDLSEGTDFNKCEDTSIKCSLCQYYYFFNKNFNYQRHLCDGCHDMSMKAN